MTPATLSVAMAVVSFIATVPLAIAFRLSQRLDRIEGKSELTDQRLAYIEADGRRQDSQLNEMQNTLREVRDATLRIESRIEVAVHK